MDLYNLSVAVLAIDCFRNIAATAAAAATITTSDSYSLL